MARDLADLHRVLDLEAIDGNIFRGQVPQVGRSRVFGGLVVAQALVAVSRTVTSDRAVHSLHGYFILPGEEALPLVYEVERLRDGRSFSTRRCSAIQAGHVIFTMVASFHRAEAGLEHQFDPPDVPPAAEAPSLEAVARAAHGTLPTGLTHWFESEGAIELRPCSLDRYDPRAPRRAGQSFWMRTRGRLADDPALHQAVLAYLSDYTLIDAAFAPHGRSLFEPSFIVASLDHALWFHRSFRIDDWVLYSQDSPSASAGRGLARGMIFDRAGRLVASVAQEGLMRFAEPDRR